MAKFNINSILNRGTFCGFSVTPMSKCRKRPRNLDRYKNSLLLDHRLQNALKVSSKPRCLGSKQAQRNAVKKTRLNSSKDNFITKNFCLSMKRKLTILLNFPFVSFIGVFSMLKCKTLVLMNARQPFCWWMSFTKVLNPFLPHPLRVDHLTFVAGYG